MEVKDIIYKTNQVNAPIVSSSLDLEILKKIYNLLENYAKKAAEYEVSKLVKQAGQSNEDFEKVKDTARKVFSVSIEVFGSEGQYEIYYDPSILKRDRLPTSIKAISFDNSKLYHLAVKKYPLHNFKIDFDFTKSPVFNLNLSPSEQTPNQSKINIYGEDSAWVSGLYKEFLDVLKNRRTKWNWIHSNNVYDLFLVILGLPLSFRYLYLIEKRFSFNQAFSTEFNVVFYLFLILLLLNIFRMLFNYLRWIFPKHELDDLSTKGAWGHRVFLGAITFALLIDLIKAVLNWIALKIF